MPITKTIVCLANSRKMSGRCLAGKVVKQGGFGEWIRPVSARESQEVSEEERRYEDGADPKLLDVVQVELLASRPHAHQSENYVIDTQYYWKRKGKVSWSAIQSAVDHPSTLWINGNHSYNGLNDRVPEVDARGLRGSLLLIRPQNCMISAAIEGGQYRKRKVRTTFEYNNEKYAIAVTDPVIEREFLGKENGEYQIGEALLCVSLGEPYQGYCYKLVAAVIRP